MGHLAAVVNESTECNAAQLVPGSGLLWYDWDKFLPLCFRPIPRITQFHHFVFEAVNPGVVLVKSRVEDNFQQVSILKTGVTVPTVMAAGLPDILPAGGLSRERQTYLYREIRPFVPGEFADELCPAVPDAWGHHRCFAVGM